MKIMSKILSAFYVFSLLVSLFLCSCSSNEYKFFKSTTAVLSVYNYSTNQWENHNVAVDVYAKKGDYDYYKVRNREGVEYGASRAMMFPSEFETWDGKAPFSVNNFRQGNLVGTLYLPF